ncbi:type II secretion system minor pseudopilin GspI [Cupriavidus basilensis]|uniref:Type II secretion system protein I n=1 Tax=Cupriavidus basilensis TaxID=68895 RepID=A0ABT6AYC4_9BURK|nr:type II secretion system minor pseudopilin GspI [Cupriavidus basilensis]MDF3837629.1 type II secretion system minor pseudopilin GspI [Cupriavidus basilensis]
MPATGFTLIEVLVALTIVAVALGACLRAAGLLADTSDSLRARAVAEWSAANRLAELRLLRRWPEPGTRRFACDQGRVALRCEEIVSGTADPLLRLVVISVYRNPEGNGNNDAGTRLAQLATVMTDGSRPGR